MPRRPEREPGSPAVVDDQLADQLLARAEERALGEKMTVRLGYDKHDPVGRGSGNSRNGPRRNGC